MTATADTVEPRVTPLRVLSLWFAFTLSVGVVAGLLLDAAFAELALDSVRASRYRAVAASALSLLTAVLVLRRRPGFDTHVAWRVNYGVIVGIWLLFGAQLATAATDVALQPLDETWFALPLGLAIGVAVEWHRNHRDP